MASGPSLTRVFSNSVIDMRCSGDGVKEVVVDVHDRQCGPADFDSSVTAITTLYETFAKTSTPFVITFNITGISHVRFMSQLAQLFYDGAAPHCMRAMSLVPPPDAYALAAMLRLTLAASPTSCPCKIAATPEEARAFVRAFA